MELKPKSKRKANKKINIAELKQASEYRGKFPKKPWCYVGGREWQSNLVLSTELIT